MIIALVAITVAACALIACVLTPDVLYPTRALLAAAADVARTNSARVST